MKNERIIPQQATYTAKEAAAYLKTMRKKPGGISPGISLNHG